ncbi:unnamed protein product [Fraxinus pennsylvanica]|uniref:Uncharacterized protein n=1 Tax=Fraxinus pennsylvanica TaxID=56036 RepID=A0AAD2DY38_9LAMI|nr:unnamed protein product [Fraxinus pennsylvanica]
MNSCFEVNETLQLNVSEDRLVSRCTICNTKFIYKLLSTEEAVEAAKGYQNIPNCLFNKNIQLWQCMTAIKFAGRLGNAKYSSGPLSLQTRTSFFCVNETFQLNVSEDRLMSWCTKRNTKFIYKLLSTE